MDRQTHTATATHSWSICSLLFAGGAVAVDVVVLARCNMATESRSWYVWNAASTKCPSPSTFDSVSQTTFDSARKPWSVASTNNSDCVVTDRQTDRQRCYSHTTRHSTRKPAWTALTVLWQTDSITTTHTHTHPFNGPLSGTTGVSRYQKGKTTLDFTEARDSEWQWHQLGHMQVCTSLQTDNHTSTPLLRIQTAYNNRIQDIRNLSHVSGTVQLCDSTNDVCCPCDRT